jgi:hypothetical protein
MLVTQVAEIIKITIASRARRVRAPKEILLFAYINCLEIFSKNTITKSSIHS